jgi:hypothetical protein
MRKIPMKAICYTGVVVCIWSVKICAFPQESPDEGLSGPKHVGMGKGKGKVIPVLN